MNVQCNLCFNTDRKTFVNLKGEDCSEIDYFLIDKIMHSNAWKRILDSMATNTSDHHPITITAYGESEVKLFACKEIINR
jgi:hypothetical protein